jgi:hypothetical protein
MEIEEIWENDLKRHVMLAQEKIEAIEEEYTKGRYSVVGDLAIKVVEQAIEAHAAKERRHLREHSQRFDFFRRYYGPKRYAQLQLLFRLYEDVGYEGLEPKAGAEKARGLMRELLEEINKRTGIEVWKPRQL